MGKKTISVMMVALLLIAALPLALAENGEGVGSGNSAAEDGSGDSGDDDVAQAAGDLDAGSLEDCVEKLGKRFPRVAPERIRNQCIALGRWKAAAGDRALMEKAAQKGAEWAEKRLEIMQKIRENTAGFRLKKLEHVASSVPGSEDFISALGEDEQEVFLHLSRARQKEMIESGSAAGLVGLKLVKVKTENLFRKRVLASEKLKIANQNYMFAKNRFENALKFQGKAKSDWLEAKRQLEACEGVESEECGQLQEEALSAAREYLQNQLSLIESHLEQVKAKVEGDENIESSRADRMLADIDAGLVRVGELEEQVEAATDKKELKTAAKDILVFWNRFKHYSAHYALNVLNARVEVILRQSEKVEERLDCAASELMGQGFDVEELNSKIDDYSALVLEAEGYRDEAKEAIGNAREIRSKGSLTEEDIEDIKEYNELAREKIGLMYETLKEAYGLLREINSEISGMGGDLSECRDLMLADGEDYDVVEDDSEDEEESDDDDSSEDDSDYTNGESDYTNSE